jgi:hypothetical protein
MIAGPSLADLSETACLSECILEDSPKKKATVLVAFEVVRVVPVICYCACRASCLRFRCKNSNLRCFPHAIPQVVPALGGGAGAGAGAAAGLGLLSVLAGASAAALLLPLAAELPAALSELSTKFRFLSFSPLKSVSYQPPPFSLKEAAVMRRPTCDTPQEGQASGSGSDIFCKRSQTWPQLRHSNS